MIGANLLNRSRDNRRILPLSLPGCGRWAVRCAIVPVALAMLGAAAQGQTIRVSESASGTQANGKSLGASISADGNHVAFLSEATNLVAGDTNTRVDVFVKNLLNGQVERVNLTSSGAQLTGDSCTASGFPGSTTLCDTPMISADARYVAFTSDASNLASPGLPQVYRRDRVTGITSLVSVGLDGNPANGGARSPRISPSGRYVTFHASGTNMQGGGPNSPYVRDLQNNVTVWAQTPTSTPGGPIIPGSFNPRISDDGRYIAFYSANGGVVAGDNNGVADIFLRDTMAQNTRIASLATSGTQGNGNSGYAGESGHAMSGNGDILAFVSRATNLDPGDTDAASDIYVRNLQSNQTSVLTGQGNGSHETVEISGDGLIVIFASTSSNLVAADSNGVRDLFAINRSNNAIQRLSVSSTGVQGNLESPTYSASASWYAFNQISVSSTGGKVAFDSLASNLVTSDTNGVADVFVRTLSAALPAPTVQFTAPSTIGVCLTGIPNPFEVSWSSTNATYCEASEFLNVTTWGVLTCIGAGCPDPADPYRLRTNQPQRSLVVRGGISPGITTTLQLTCYGADGQSASATRSVAFHPDPCATSPNFAASSAVSAPASMPDGSFQLQSSVSNPQGVALTAAIVQQGQHGDAAVEVVGNTVVVRYLPRNGSAIRATIVNETIQVAVVGGGVAVPVTYNFQVDLSLFSNGFEGGGGGGPAALQENFDGVSGSPTCPAFWQCLNLSSPAGNSSWSQGDVTRFAAQSGASGSYLAADVDNAASTGTISNWLTSPPVLFTAGNELRFWTRTATGQRPDRLEVRVSTTGGNPGNTATSVGDFTILLGTVNPSLIASTGNCTTPAAAPGSGAYPTQWCEYRITSAQGLPTSGNGRIGFRYYVTNGGPSGSNSDYIGIDTIRLGPAP